MNKNIDWSKRLKLCKKEIIVGRVCLECGEIIGEDAFHTRFRHIECNIKHRKRYEKARYSYVKKFFPPKYCIDCGVLLDKIKWNKSHIIRCDLCQFKKNKKYQSKYYKSRTCTVIAVTCVVCGEIMPCHHSATKYCRKHRHHVNKKHKDKKLTYEEQNKQTKEFQKKLVKKNKIERLGTYDTSLKYDIAVKGNGINFEREEKAVQILKKKTFNKLRKKLFSLTEGDIKRGIK